MQSKNTRQTFCLRIPWSWLFDSTFLTVACGFRAPLSLLLCHPARQRVSPPSPPTAMATDSGTRLNSPYYGEELGAKEAATSAYGSAQAPRKGVSKWIKFGIPVVVIVILAAVLGGVFGSRAAKNRSDSSGSGDSKAGADPSSSGHAGKGTIGRFATATNSAFMVPVYPSTVSRNSFTSSPQDRLSDW